MVVYPGHVLALSADAVRQMRTSGHGWYGGIGRGSVGNITTVAARYPIPASLARRMACVRSATCNLLMMLET